MRKVLTKEGKVKMQEELNFLITIEKKQAIEELAESKENGDLSENTQYLNAKEECKRIQAKIEELETILRNSVVVDASTIKTDKVSILTSVKVINKTLNKEMIFHIVPDNEIEPKSMKISTTSPIASGLLGKTKGDLCEVVTPIGKMTLEILDIKTYES